MVIDQVDVAGGVRLFVISENQTPVSRDGQAPDPFPLAFERVKLPSGKPAELAEILGGFKGEQKLAQLVGHRRRHPLCLAVLIEMPKPLVAKPCQLHFTISSPQYVRLYRTRQVLCGNCRSACSLSVPRLCQNAICSGGVGCLLSESRFPKLLETLEIERTRWTLWRRRSRLTSRRPQVQVLYRPPLLPGVVVFWWRHPASAIPRGRSEVGLSRLPVTQEIAGSSPVGPATISITSRAGTERFLRFQLRQNTFRPAARFGLKY